MKTGFLELGVAKRSDDRARERPDVGAAVAADLGLVTYAADRDADELAPERAGDRLAERGLAHSRRADEAEDRAGEVLLQLRHGELLDDPLLHLLEVVVVLVEDGARVLEVEVVLGRLVPRKREDPLEIPADDAVLGCGGRKLGEPVELAAGCAVGLLGKMRLLDLAAELRYLGLLLVAFAELVLDRLELLAEEVLALRVLHLRLHLGLDLRAELEHLELAVQDDGELPQACLDGRLLEELLLLGGLEAHRRRDQVRERARILRVRGCELELVGQVGDEADDAAEERLDVPRERVDLLLRPSTSGRSVKSPTR